YPRDRRAGLVVGACRVPVNRTRRIGRRLRAEDELGIRQDEPQTLLDAVVDRALRAAARVLLEDGIEICARDRTAIRAPAEAREDRPGTGSLVHRLGRLTREYP